MPVVLALGSALVYGVGDYLGGRASRHQPSVLVALVGQIVSLAMVLVAVALVGTAAPDASTWAWSAFGGVAGALGIAGLYHGLSHGDVSVVAPTSAVVGAVVPVVWALVTGERPSALALVGIVLAVAAVALVSGALGTHQHSTPRSIILLAVLVGGAFGILFVAFDRADSGSGLWPLVIARLSSVPVLALLALGLRARPSGHRPSLYLAMAVGAIDMSSNWLYLEAARSGLLSVVAVIASLYPASTVVLASTIDKERVGRWQAVGMALAVVAVVVVTLSRQ